MPSIYVDCTAWKKYTGRHCFDHYRAGDDPSLCHFARWNPLHKEFFCGMYDSLPLKTETITIEIIPFGLCQIEVPCRCDNCEEDQDDV